MVPDNVYDYLKAQEQAALKGEATSNELYKRDVRMQSLEQYAFQSAARQGIKARLLEIEKSITGSARDLDAIYDFGPLLIKGKVIPPVITEANDIYNLEDSTTIRTSDRIYQIKSQARFSSIASNWRAYMQFPTESKAYSSEVFISKALMPENDAEKQVWVAATVKGWDSGVEQANVMLENNFKRLNRDYVGMVRFHEFVLQGKLTMPLISEYDLDNSNDGNTMVLNEQMLKLTQLPQFENKWIRNPDSRGFPNRGTQLSGQEVQVMPPITVDMQNSTVRDIQLKVANHELTPKYRVQDNNNAYDRNLSSNTIMPSNIIKPDYQSTSYTNSNANTIQAEKLESISRQLSEQQAINRQLLDEQRANQKIMEQQVAYQQVAAQQAKQQPTSQKAIRLEPARKIDVIQNPSVKQPAVETVKPKLSTFDDSDTYKNNKSNSLNGNYVYKQTFDEIVYTNPYSEVVPVTVKPAPEPVRKPMVVPNQVVIKDGSGSSDSKFVTSTESRRVLGVAK